MPIRRPHAWVLALLIVVAAVAATARVAAQPEPAAQPAGAQHAAPAAEHAAEAGDHPNPVVDLIARLFNFGLLAGTLVYFLRSPIADYLRTRGTQIRGDLARAAEMKQSAAAQVAEVERKMAALPAELNALRQTGAEEVAAEEARMREAAESERAHLLEQSRRDIRWQLRIAERELQLHAAALAVDLATTRVKATINDADQSRLVDRYITQVAPGSRESTAGGQHA
jgi:F-type H+-transporting ATPase subunit b